MDSFYLSVTISPSPRQSMEGAGISAESCIYVLGSSLWADTSGKNRFMPPQKPEPWTDVRPAVFMGIRRRNVWRTGGPIITELLPIIGTTGM